jgi:hypothetical protein
MKRWFLLLGLLACVYCIPATLDANVALFRHLAPGAALAYDDCCGNSFGSREECLEWWSYTEEACPAESGGGGGGEGGGEGGGCGSSQLIGDPNDGKVYLRDSDGVYHWIPDPETGNAIGIDWNAIDWCGAPGSMGVALPSVNSSSSFLATGNITYGGIIIDGSGVPYWGAHLTPPPLPVSEPVDGDLCYDEGDEYITSTGQVLECQRGEDGVLRWRFVGSILMSPTPNVPNSVSHALASAVNAIARVIGW